MSNKNKKTVVIYTQCVEGDLEAQEQISKLSDNLIKTGWNVLPNNPLPNIYKCNAVGNSVMVFGVIMLLILALSVYLISIYNGSYPKCSILLGALWVVGAPGWFFIEHFFIFKKYGDVNQYDQFKRGQELASKIWAGGILVLAAAWSGNFPGT